jgi:outer membrane cobalamin receptor
LILISLDYCIILAEEKAIPDSLNTEGINYELFNNNVEIENLKNNNYEGIDNLLSVYPGIDINELGYPGQLLSLNYRGTSYKGISFSIDGIPFESYIFGAPDLNWIPYEALNNIDFLKYPTFNPGYLTLDFKTKSIQNDEPFTRVDYRIGDFERSFTDVFFNRKLTNSSDIQISGNFEKYPGQFLDDNYYGRRFFSCYKRTLSKNFFLKFSGMYMKSGVDVPYEILSTKKLASHNSRTDNNIKFLSVSLSRIGENAQFDTYFYLNKNRISFRNKDKTENLMEDNEDIYGSGFSFKRMLNKGDLSGKFNVSTYSVKLDRVYQFKKERKISTFLNYNYIFKERFDINPYFAFFDDSMMGRLSTGGLTICSNFHKNLGAFFSYRLNDRFCAIQEIYHIIVYDRIMKNVGTINHNLKNEKSNTFEMGMVYKSKKNIISWNIFHNTIDNMINVNYNPNWEESLLPFNDSRNSFWGTEININSSFLKFFQILMRYSYQENSKNKKDYFLFNPKESGYSSFIINDIEDIFIKGHMNSMIVFSCKYVDKKSIKNYNPLIRDFYLSNEFTEPSFIFNFKGMLKIKTVTLMYEVDNIFGEDFIEVYGYPIPKGTIRMGIQWDFFN